MATCKYEQFKATAAPGHSKANVMFCRCAYCMAARAYRGLPLEPGRISERVDALNWKPETEADADGKVGE